MMKYIKLGFIILILFLQTGCTGQAVKQAISNQTAAVNGANQVQPILSEGKQFKVIGSFAGGWHYILYDKKGNVIESRRGNRVPPDIKYVSDNVIEERFHGGTYADNCRYYDVDSGKFSDYYENPFLVQDGKIVYFNEQIKKLIIRNIFDESIYYRDFEIDISCTQPPISTQLIDSDTHLVMAYYNGANTRIITETFNLQEGN